MRPLPVSVKLDTGRLDAHYHLPGSGLRIRDLLQFHHVGRAGRRLPVVPARPAAQRAVGGDDADVVDDEHRPAEELWELAADHHMEVLAGLNRHGFVAADVVVRGARSDGDRPGVIADAEPCGEATEGG